MEANLLERATAAAPQWLEKVSQKAERDDNNYPDIGALIPIRNLINPDSTFDSADQAVTTIEGLLRSRSMNFILSYHFMEEQNPSEFHLAISIDLSGTIYVLSNRIERFTQPAKIDGVELINLISSFLRQFDPSNEVIQLYRNVKISPDSMFDVVEEESWSSDESDDETSNEGGLERNEKDVEDGKNVGFQGTSPSSLTPIAEADEEDPENE